jgi:hypothetical protein
MKKYLQEIIQEIESMEKGVTTNPADWTNMPVTLVQITALKTDLIQSANAIETAEATAQIARHDGLAKNANGLKLYNQAVDLAYGIYANNPEKLAEYGIKPRREPSKVPPPTSILAIEISDDTDGEGFILLLTAKDPVSDNYEWQKGQGLDPKDMHTIPDMTFFKFTTKMQFVDDNVTKGVRYFYRVRALNRNGQGPWSEPVSRVQ